MRMRMCIWLFAVPHLIQCIYIHNIMLVPRAALCKVGRQVQVRAMRYHNIHPHWLDFIIDDTVPASSL